MTKQDLINKIVENMAACNNIPGRAIYLQVYQEILAGVALHNVSRMCAAESARCSLRLELLKQDHSEYSAGGYKMARLVQVCDTVCSLIAEVSDAG